MITKEILAQLAPQADPAFAEAISGTLERFSITAPQEQAAFLAQLVHESAGLRTFVENLNYSAMALPAVFNTKSAIRFTPATAERYGRTATHAADQVMIANIAYANRMGNGPVTSGDGWRYRGRGPIQLTGRDNYARCGKALNLNLVASPDLLLAPVNGCLAAGWFWDEGNRTGKSLNLLSGDIDAVSKAVNGGSKGLAERRSLFTKFLKVLS